MKATLEIDFPPEISHAQAEAIIKALETYHKACGGGAFKVTLQETSGDPIPAKPSLPRSANPTAREREVLKMLAEGNSVKEIACDLNVSIKTIEVHKYNLMRKLDIHNKEHLVRYAVQNKIMT